MRWIKFEGGTAITPPMGKPATVVLEDGARVGAAHWEAAELAPFGWYAIEGAANPVTQTETGYTLDAAAGVARPILATKPVADVRAAKLAELAALRFNKETAGVAGIRTDRESQALLTGAALAASLDPGYTVDWKGEAGWTTLNAVQLLGAAQAVRGHVQACFSNERAHATAIALLDTVEAIEAYDLSSGWPA